MTGDKEVYRVTWQIRVKRTPWGMCQLLHRGDPLPMLFARVQPPSKEHNNGE